ncbi:putative glucan endo-1,3-beta-glucosidase GVI [Spatholobus suberectus]|nr:putative glucan endo-1,3-beta-glucosidase GVI [Spatholobus suberectus]
MDSKCGRTLFVMTTILLIQQFPLTSAQSIGVNLGLNADNLPSPKEIVELYEKYHIRFIRIFEPRHDILEALRGKPLVLAVGTRDEDVESIAQDQNVANAWVQTNVVPYIKDVKFGYIALGNEVTPGPIAPYVAKGIRNMINALTNAGIHKDIKVSAVLKGSVLAASYPPSAGAFTDEAANVVKQIAPILLQHGSPVMINTYPYFACSSEPQHISLDYALFKSTSPVVTDGGYKYYNLFDAMLDAYHAAFEKIGVSNITLVVSETGWPSAGNEPHTSKQNAKAYNKNLMQHVRGGKGTPRRPGQSLNVFIFAMFNEDLKQPGVEHNFGVFYPNKQPVYPLF